MRGRIWIPAAIVIALISGSAPVPAAAQTEGSPADTRKNIVMQQIGYPGMFSTRLLVPVHGFHMLGPGVTFLPELTGVGAEYRYQLGRPREERFGFHFGAGSTYYYITESGESTSTIGGHVYLGTLYRTRSNFALGADLGYIGTSGSENSIRSFKMERGIATTYLNFSVALLF
jgi:hypothetical protein